MLTPPTKNSRVWEYRDNPIDDFHENDWFMRDAVTNENEVLIGG